MSLNNITLSHSLLAELYANVLVQGPSVKKPAMPPVSFLGKNEKNILILVNQKDTVYLPEKDLAFLSTVLSACQLGLSDIAIVNWALFKEGSFVILQEQLSPKKVLLLDVKPEGVGLPSSEFYTVKSHVGLEFVATPALSEIEKTKQTKSRFWVALKELFCL